jgi:nitroreductase
MELLPEINARIATRKFKPDPISKEAVESILEAGRLAPSAKNRQAWRFIVIQNPDLRMTIQDAAFGQEYIGSAPCTFAVCTTNVDYKMPNGQLSYPVDLGIAGAFMCLQATSLGLGSCFVTIFDEQQVKTALSVPYSMRVVILLTVGFADEQPERAPRFPLSRIVSYDHW